MNSLDVIKEIYKPYRYTKRGKTVILESTQGNYVVKEKKKDIRSVYNYLKSRGFNNFPNLVDDSRSDIDVFEYIDDVEMPTDQKINDLAVLVGNLHKSTAYYKEISEDTYKSIYENIKNNVLYLDNLYDEMFNKFLAYEYPSPSNSLFLNHYTMLKNVLKYCLTSLDEWYSSVKNINKQRISLIHNNLSLDHYLKSDKDYLISWDLSTFDTPILDIYKLYQKEFMNVEFKSVLDKYLEKFKLDDNEIKILFILISIPLPISFGDSEFKNTIEVRNCLDYVYKTDKLIKDYAKNE